MEVSQQTIPKHKMHKAICSINDIKYPGIVGCYDVPIIGQYVSFFPAIGRLERGKIYLAEEIEVSPEFIVFGKVLGFHEVAQDIIPEIIILVAPASYQLAEIAEDIIHDATNRRYPNGILDREDDLS